MARWLVCLSALALGGCFNGVLLTPVNTASPVEETVVCESSRPLPCRAQGASIGVIMSLYNASGLFGMIGVKSNPIKSGPNKDLGNPAREMTREEHDILQGMVNSFYDQFVQVVARGRGLPEERVRALADGRVYTGLDAKKLGLVDEVGYLEDALATAMQMANIKDAALAAYDRGEGYRGSIYAGLPKNPSEISVKLD